MSWTKEQRAIAKEKGKALFSASIDGRYTKSKTGVYHHSGPVDLKPARIAFFFTLYVVFEKMTPKAAFDKVVKMVEKE